MDGWADTWMDGYINKIMHKWVNGWTDWRVNGLMDGWVDRWVDGWTNGWVLKWLMLKYQPLTNKERRRELFYFWSLAPVSERNLTASVLEGHTHTKQTHSRRTTSPSKTPFIDAFAFDTHPSAICLRSLRANFLHCIKSTRLSVSLWGGAGAGLQRYAHKRPRCLSRSYIHFKQLIELIYLLWSFIGGVIEQLSLSTIWTNAPKSGPSSEERERKRRAHRG